ncbi:MAG: oxidoreductase [Arenicella sp.]
MLDPKQERASVLAGQVVFISGACGLIGQRFVEVCLEAGASVIAADINEEQLKALSEKLPSSNLLTLVLDLTSSEDVQSALNKSVQYFGSVTALVNVAYPRNKQYGRHFFEVEYADFCENLNLNVGTTFSASQIFSRYFQKQRQGNIVNLGSIYGVIAPDFDVYPGSMTMPVEYAAIKSAVIHLTKYMAQMLRKDGVRVNCISPGGVLDAQPEAFLEKYNAKCGQQGMLDAKHLDSTLLYLLSPASIAVTGQNIVVDDGFSL